MLPELQFRNKLFSPCQNSEKIAVLWAKCGKQKSVPILAARVEQKLSFTWPMEVAVIVLSGCHASLVDMPPLTH